MEIGQAAVHDDLPQRGVRNVFRKARVFQQIQQQGHVLIRCAVLPGQGFGGLPIYGKAQV